MAWMCALVTPSARQCGPPELFATLPPIEQVCWLLGSGAKCTPRCAICRDRSRFRTPGSTHANRLIGSTDRIRFIFDVEMTIEPRDRHRAPGQPGAGATGHERHLELVRDADDRLDVLGRSRRSTRRRPHRRGWTHRGGTGGVLPPCSGPDRDEASSAAAGPAARRSSGNPTPLGWSGSHDDDASALHGHAVDEHLISGPTCSSSDTRRPSRRACSSSSVCFITMRPSRTASTTSRDLRQHVVRRRSGHLRRCDLRRRRLDLPSLRIPQWRRRRRRRRRTR